MRLFFTSLILLTALPALADSPTLDRIAESGALRIGYVPDAPPLSFTDEAGDVVGYSIDLCREIADDIRIELGLEKLDTVYVPLMSIEDRIAAVEEARVDIECGATTVTLTRRERVDFTLMTYITGTAILSRQASPIMSVDEVRDKRIAARSGTTTEAVLRDMAEVNEIPFKLALVNTHDDGMALLNKGEVDGYASDRAMLIGQVFRGENARNRYMLSRGALSFEPYALMIRRGDTEFRLLADRALADIYRTARIRRLHQIWFGRYDEQITPIVEAMYQFQAVSD